MTHSPALSSMARIFRNTIEQRRERIVAFSAELVAAQSVNPPGDTRDVAAVVSATLRQLGIESRFESSTPTMPSVVAELDSGRPGPHLVLNVHMDTMPPGNEDAWLTPIYELTRTAGRLHGLGMGNMKGAVAAMVHALSLLAENAAAWNGRVTFTAVSDEVVFGENGAAHLLGTHQELTGDGLICGEGPGFKRLAIAEKGVLWLEVSATGDAGHSSSVKKGRSASARIGRVIAHVDELNGRRFASPPELAGLFSPEDPGFELTANVGTVTAGSFIGQVAVEGRAEIDLRLPPGVTADAAEAMVAEIAETVGGVSVRRIKAWDSNWTSPHSTLARAWHIATEALDACQAPLAIRLPASDASRWRLRGTPALCYGPQPTLSSGVDDYAEEDEVLACAVLYATAALAFLAGSPDKSIVATAEPGRWADDDDPNSTTVEPRES